MVDLTGRTVVVTGGFGVLGQATATAAREAGARVGLIDFAKPLPGLGFDAVRGGVDLADASQARAAMAGLAEALGPIDGLINIAGGFEFQTLEDGDGAVWAAMFRINLMTAVCACRAVLPHLREGGGAIVNVAAAAAARAGAGMGAYAASKAGVLRLTESLAEEVKGRSVRVNAVSPTILDTPRNRADMPKADFSKWVAPSELAAAVLFLIGDGAAAVTGADVRVAGKT